MAVTECTTKAAFDEELRKAGDKLVVVDFFATWCGPCRTIGPKVVEMAKENPSVVFLKVDVDKNDETSEQYEVQAMPTFLFFKCCNKVDTLVGANESKLKALIQKNQ